MRSNSVSLFSLLIFSIGLIGCSKSNNHSTKATLIPPIKLSVKKPNVHACNDNKDCEIQQECSMLESEVSVPTADLPTDKDKAELKGCEPDSYFYGFMGYEVDYEKARKCALLNPDVSYSDGAAYPLGSNQILEMIYANGYKVNQNLMLAAKYACKHQALKDEIEALSVTNFDVKNPFSTCNYDEGDPNVQTTCTNWLEWQINKSSRTRKFNQIIAKWAKPDIDAFNHLITVYHSYVSQYITSAVDLGVYEDRITDSTTDDLEADFSDKFINIINGKLPKYSDAEFAELDKQLNQLYKKTINYKVTDDNKPFPNFDIDAIKQAQRAWVNYKEAWVEFGKIHYPNVSANSFRAFVTKDRIDDLTSLLETITGVDNINESGSY